MVYNLRNFVFIYVIIVINALHTFAPWTKKPKPPAIGTMGTCYFWLHHDGFTDDNVENQKLAIDRKRKFDQDVSYFSAGYAYLLSNRSELFNINRFGPDEFCRIHTVHYVTYPFMTLKDAEFTCEGWIDFYLYDENREVYRCKTPNKNPKYFNWANNRDRSMDSKISLWAARYFHFITSDDEKAYTTPTEFCILIGKPVMTVPLPTQYPFMTINGTKMSCNEWDEVKGILDENVFAELNSRTVTKLPFTASGTTMTCYEWIKLCGYSDDNSENSRKILAKDVDLNALNSLANFYVTYVLEHHKTHEEYKQLLENQIEYQIQFIGDLVDLENLNVLVENVTKLQHYLEDIGDPMVSLMTPIDFCRSRNMPESMEVDYFGFLYYT